MIGVKHALQKGDFRLDVDTQIPAIGITGLFGESGSGKTTLLRCIAGLEQTEPRDPRPAHKRAIGYVSQKPQLFAHLDVRRNIEFGWRRCRKPSTSIDEVVGWLELDALLERRTAELSGGEAQRVSIARALCQSPELVLMDEPLSALDEGKKAEILPYLDRVHAESSLPVVYVSHNIDEICRLSDHLLVMAAGRIVADGELQATLMKVELPPLAGANAGAVLQARQARYDAEFDLTLFEFSGGTLWVPGRYAADTVRLRVAASDISLARVAAESSTILNILPARIESIVAESDATTLIRLRLNDNALIARITRRSLQELQLKVDDNVYAQIKSVTVRLQ